MNTLVALAVTLALMIWPAIPDDAAFCEWLDAADTHYDVLSSFSPIAAYDLLAYPLPLAQDVSARLIVAGCDY